MLTITFGFPGLPSQSVSFSDLQPAATQTAAIQTALDAVAGHPGAFVQLSGGTFTVTGTGKAADGALRVGSETTFSGAGAGQTIIKLADGSSSVTGIIRTDSGNTLADGSIKTVSNVTISGLTIDGNKAHTSGDVDGFYTGPKPNSSTFDSNITLDRVEIHDVSRYGFDPHEQTRGLTISNSSSHNNGADGFTIDYASDVTLINNDAYNNGRHGFNIVTSSSNVHFQNNDAWGNGQSGITVQTGDNELRPWTQNISISGGHLHDNGRAGIEVRQVSGVSISDVWIDHNKAEGIILTGVNTATLSHNALQANGGTVRIEGFLQDFGDKDAANDRWIGSHNVSIDGVKQTDPAIPSGVKVFTYAITSGADSISGSSGRDVITSAGGNDTVKGNGGNDTLYGEGGNDKLSGGTGSDALFGGDGSDWLSGDAGWDTLSGGGGSDTFAFLKGWSSDTITDFRHGTDTLDFRGISGLTSLSQLAILQTGADTKITYGSDSVLLKGIAASTLDANDFLLA